MSSVVISGDTSGAITLSAPVVAGTNTITLPASTGTVVTTGSPQSGGVIQTVNTQFSTYYTNNTANNTYVDVSGFSASITPKFSTSKVLVLVTINGVCTLANSSTGVEAYLRITDGSGNLIFGIIDGIIAGGTGNGSAIWACYVANYLHSPATTSSITYKLQYRMPNTGIQINNYGNINIANSGITLMEIAA